LYTRYDSEDSFPARFSFNWAGSADVCGVFGGLPSILEDHIGSQRFLNSTQPDADFIIASLGTHDVVGSIPLEDYHRLIPQFFDLLLRQSPKVAIRPNRFIWRSSPPFVRFWDQPICDSKYYKDANAAIGYMNLYAARQALAKGISVVDTNRIGTAAETDRAAHNDGQCGDHLHCWHQDLYYPCEPCMSQGIVLVHYLMVDLAPELLQDDNDDDDGSVSSDSGGGGRGDDVKLLPKIELMANQ